MQLIYHNLVLLHYLLHLLRLNLSRVVKARLCSIQFVHFHLDQLQKIPIITILTFVWYLILRSYALYIVIIIYQSHWIQLLTPTSQRTHSVLWGEFWQIVFDKGSSKVIKYTNAYFQPVKLFWSS